MDGILVDLLGKWLRVYNRENGTRLRVSQVKNWELHKLATPAIYNIVKRPGFFDKLPAHRGAIDGMAKLADQGHDLVVCSSPTGPDSERAKLAWCKKHLGFNRRKVIRCHDKHKQAGDAIIDDRPSTCAKFIEQGRIAVTIDYPYNRRARCSLRAHSYSDTRSAWSQIVDFFGNDAARDRRPA